LTRNDFSTLRLKLSLGKEGQTYSPVTLKRRLTIARMVFAYANEEMEQSLRYKKPLKAPERRVIRRREREREKLLYDAKTIRMLVKAADPHLRAMILLGINCGFNPRDCCTLPTDAIDGKWHNYARPKTEVERLRPLWPETMRALKAIKSSRYVFNGRKWTRHVVGRMFAALCKECKVKNCGF
jgi:integrase